MPRDGITLAGACGPIVPTIGETSGMDPARLADRTPQPHAEPTRTGVDDGTAEGQNGSGRRSRIRVRGERRLCANAGDPQPTEHRHQGIRVSRPPQWPSRQPIRSPVVGCCRLQQNNNWMEMPLGRQPGAEQSAVSAVD